MPGCPCPQYYGGDMAAYVNEARRGGRKKECKCMKLGRKGGREGVQGRYTRGWNVRERRSRRMS